MQRIRLGESIRSEWGLTEGITFLNHGSFGAAPRPVLDAQQEWRRRLEQQPVLFMGRTLTPELRRVATELGEFLGARGEDLVWVDNATTGANAVLRSLPFQAGDQIVTTSHGYGAVQQAVRYVCQQSGAQSVIAEVPFPIHGSAAVVKAVEACLTPQTRLVILDHITSPTGLIFPVHDLVQRCHKQGIPVLIDGAHAPGMIPLDLEQLGADWYTGNLHKWVCAPKGAAFLWTHPNQQAHTHPTVISHGFGSGYLAEFDWTGTKDPSPWLAVSAALEWQRRIRAERIRYYCHELVWQAAQLLSEVWNVKLPAPVEMLGSMATLPLPGGSPFSHPELEDPEAALITLAAQVHDQLWDQHQIEVPIIPFQGRLWIRISAQVYNELSDYRRLAACLGIA